MRKIFLSFLLGLFLMSCNKTEQPQQKTAFDGKINSESIFNLNSKWQTMDGKEIQLADLQGKVLAMTMVYTSCAASCPVIAADMKAIQEKVGNKDAENLRYVFVSLDPDQDTPEKMKHFMEHYGVNSDQFLFLRSDPESTRELANVFGVRYKKEAAMEISHSNVISVFTKGGDLAYQRVGLKGDTKIIDEIRQQL